MKKVMGILLVLIVVLSGCAQYESSTKLDRAVDKEETQNDVEDARNNKSIVVLYHGIPLDKADTKIDVFGNADITQKQKLLTKYETVYYSYANGNYLGKTIGMIEERGLDYFWQVIYSPEIKNGEIAISQAYNPYPRKILSTDSNFYKEFIANSDTVLNEINKKFDVISEIEELFCVDLDGDGINEYIVFVLDKNNSFFTKCLIDSKYKIVSYLTVFKEKHENFKEIVENNNLSDSSEIIDVNNDGIMEIIVNVPSYEGFLFKVFTYKHGVLYGDFITECSLLP